jgi:hypothetical protein
MTVSSAAGNVFLTDIGIGASSSEVVLWGNMPHWAKISVNQRATLDNWWHFPTIIPAGSRLSTRCQADGTNKGMSVTMMLFPVTFQSRSYPSAVIEMGADEASSEGTEIDPGGTVDTKGDWVELTASSTHLFKGLKMGFTTSGRNVNMSACYMRFDIGIGSEGNEEVLISNFPLNVSGVRDSHTPRNTPLFPVSIPKGTRISVRAACTINDATDRLEDVILYGVT